MKKKIKEVIRITCNSGKATPTPPISPILGQRGLSANEFCKEFNEYTKNLSENIPYSTSIHVYENRIFKILFKGVPLSYFIRKFNELNISAATPTKIDVRVIYHIAETLRSTNLNFRHLDKKAICNMIIATLISNVKNIKHT